MNTPMTNSVSLHSTIAVRFSLLAILILQCGNTGRVQAGEYSFRGLGDLPGGDFYSRADAISADGSTVVGSSNSAIRTQAFRWTGEEGLASLGEIADFTNVSYANDVSSDGSIVVGSVRSLQQGYRGYRWTAETGMVKLPTPTESTSFGNAVSADGRVIGGLAAFRASVWIDGAESQPLSFPQPSANGNTVQALSADGSMAVGSFGTGSTTLPYRWSANTGLQELELLSGDESGTALAVSADGSVVVGKSENNAVRWTADGVEYLGTNTLIAYAMSADGSVIGGQGVYDAFIWTPTGGSQLLSEVLIAAGLSQVQDWELANVTGISADGRTLVGNGLNPQRRWEAWIATIPEPSTYLLAALGLLAMLTVRRRN
jgi:uncharacterized membrane protein